MQHSIRLWLLAAAALLLTACRPDTQDILTPPIVEVTYYDAAATELPSTPPQAISLSDEDAVSVILLLDRGTWEDGSEDSAMRFEWSINGTLYQCSDSCTIIHVPTKSRRITLSEDDAEALRAILLRYTP